MLGWRVVFDGRTLIGLLGVKIWHENEVDFGNPLNLVPIAAGVIIGIGNTTLKFTDDFQLTGISLGTIVTIVAYHGAGLIAPAHLKTPPHLKTVVGSPDADGVVAQE